LSEDRPDLTRVLHPLLVGDQTVDFNMTARRDKDPAQHLNGRGLARAVRPDVTDQFPFVDPKGNIIHRGDGLVLRAEQRPHAAEKPFAAYHPLIFLCQMLYLNHVIVLSPDAFHE
jgi:hypothetical protein